MGGTKKSGEECCVYVCERERGEGEWGGGGGLLEDRKRDGEIYDRECGWGRGRENPCLMLPLVIDHRTSE